MLKLLIIFIFLIPVFYLLYLVILYFRTKVPYMTTSKKYWPVLFDNLKIDEGMAIYELGCGKADFLFFAEKFKPKKLVGFELSPLHVIWVKVKAFLLQSKVKVYWQDFLKVDIVEADIIYLFLTKTFLDEMWPELKKKLKLGALVLVLGVKIDGEKCDKVIEVGRFKNFVSEIYVYKKGVL